MSLINLLDLLPAELETLAESLSVPRYRGRQIASWIYAKGAADIAAMSDLPKEFRQKLAAASPCASLPRSAAASAAPSASPGPWGSSAT